jgi:transcriptional regulator with XRE-family HTH domain
MSTALRLVAVLPTEAELATRARRRSWWLLVARLASGTTQAAAASAAGLSAASSYGDFERAVTEPSLKQLALLAAAFGVPLSLLADPPETDEERLEKITGRRSMRITSDSDQNNAVRRATG